MTPVTHRRRARRGEGQLLREEIIAAAERLLIERGGEEAVSIRAIADAVGVTPPSIYLHFADKDELFLAVCDARFDTLGRLSTEAAAGATDPLDEIRRRGEAYIRFGLGNPEQYRVLFLNAEDSQTSVGMEEVARWACLADLVEAIRRGQADGTVAGDDPYLVAMGLWAAVHGLVALLITKPAIAWLPPDVLIDHLLTTQMMGLLPRPPAG